MSIFEKRVTYKPYEYPDVIIFKDKIRESYWTHKHWNFIGDIQDFHVLLDDKEKNVIKNTMMAISQIEVSVKEFWAKIGDRFPKSEFKQVGITFGESEVRHADAYSHLLELLGFNSEFDQLLQNPVIQGRVDYLTKYLKGAAENSNESYTLALTLFSIFIENVSLFSQFLIIKSFQKSKNVLKDIDNVVQATQKEELLHALFGVQLIKYIRDECPDWFNEDFYAKLERACKKAFVAECDIVDWIFEKGDLSFIDRESVKEFIKSRFNESMELVGGKAVFEIDEEKIKKVYWFIEEIHAYVMSDFFHKRPVTYSINVKSVTAADLF